MPNLYPDILDKNQGSVLPRLFFLKKYSFYLAGGTALTLLLGHRTSVDFDFFSPKHFDSEALFADLEREFGNDVKKISEEKDTLFVKILDIDVSFFWYKYKPITAFVQFKRVPLSSTQDIAAMKLLAITGRPAVRDYIDIFYLLKSFNLPEIFSFADKKYPNFNDYLALRALTYFEDVTEIEGKRPIKITDPGFSWEKAKKYITEEVKKYQLSMFRK